MANCRAAYDRWRGPLATVERLQLLVGDRVAELRLEGATSFQ